MIKRLVISFLLLIPFLSFSQPGISLSDLETTQIHSFLDNVRDSIYSIYTINTSKNVYYLVDSHTMNGVVTDVIRGDQYKETVDSLQSIVTYQEESTVMRDSLITDYKQKDSLNTEKSLNQNKELKTVNKQLKAEKLKTTIGTKIVLPVVGAVAILEGIIIAIRR